MLTDDELQKRIDGLNGDLTEICEVLSMSNSQPTGDLRLLSYFEALLEDRRPCLLGIGATHYFGELRWLAAEAVSAERQEADLTEHVMLYGVVKPMTPQPIYDLAREAGIDVKKVDILDMLGRLIEMGKAPLIDNAFPFPARLRKKKE